MNTLVLGRSRWHRGIIRGLWIGIWLVVFSSLTLTDNLALAQDPALTVDPESGPPGAAVELSYSNYPGGGDGLILFDGVKVGTFVIDASGSGTLDGVVPADATIDVHTITVCEAATPDTCSAKTASVNFTVTEPTATPTATETSTPTETATPSETPTETLEPTATPTETAVPTDTPLPTATPTSVPPTNPPPPPTAEPPRPTDPPVPTLEDSPVEITPSATATVTETPASDDGSAESSCREVGVSGDT